MKRLDQFVAACRTVNYAKVTAFAAGSAIEETKTSNGSTAARDGGLSRMGIAARKTNEPRGGGSRGSRRIGPASWADSP